MMESIRKFFMENLAEPPEEGSEEEKGPPRQTDIAMLPRLLRTRPRLNNNKKQEHLGSSRQYWRDIILGVNDGLVSTFLLVAGVAGGGLSSNDILLTAIAGALAGAISMCAGK